MSTDRSGDRRTAKLFSHIRPCKDTWDGITIDSNKTWMFLIALNEFPCRAQCQRICNFVSIPLYFPFFFDRANADGTLSLFAFLVLSCLVLSCLSSFWTCLFVCGICFWRSLSFVSLQCFEQTLANAVTEMQKSVKYKEEFKHLQISAHAVWNPLLIYIVLLWRWL